MFTFASRKGIIHPALQIRQMTIFIKYGILILFVILLDTIFSNNTYQYYDETNLQNIEYTFTQTKKTIPDTYTSSDSNCEIIANTINNKFQNGNKTLVKTISTTKNEWKIKYTPLIQYLQYHRNKSTATTHDVYALHEIII